MGYVVESIGYGHETNVKKNTLNLMDSQGENGALEENSHQSKDKHPNHKPHRYMSQRRVDRMGVTYLLQKLI
jgi:hypothetical protein